MADVRTRVPAPREALDEYEQLAAEVALFNRDRVNRIVFAWLDPISRGARRRYDDAVQRAEQLALDAGRVTALDDGALVADVAAAYARLDDLLISSRSGKPVPVMVDIAYAMLTADLLDAADLEAITTRWAGVLEGPEQPAREVIDVPLTDEPADDQVVDDPAPTGQAGRPAGAARRVDPLRRRRRLRVRAALVFILAALAFIGACFLLGLAGAGDVPAGAGGAGMVLAVILTVYGAITAWTAGQIRRR